MLLQAADRDRWNDFVRASTYPSVMQSWEWGELKAATGWTPLVVALEDDGALRAGALVLERPLPHLRRGLLYAPRGPVLDWSTLICSRADRRDPRWAVAWCGGGKIDPGVPAERRMWRSAGGPGLPLCGLDDPDRAQPRYVMKTDLRPGRGAAGEFHSKWRYNIRLAERKGVTVREGTRADLPEFYRVLQITAERDRFRVRGLDYYERLYDLLAPAGMAKLFVAEVEGQVVSGAILFRMGREAVYVYGASDNEHRNLMPNHLLQWTMMRWARAQGCEVYDFRGVSREVDGEPMGELGGLNRFKRGFAAQYMEYIGEYDLVLSPFWYRAMSVARRLRG